MYVKNMEKPFQPVMILLEDNDELDAFSSLVWATWDDGNPKIKMMAKKILDLLGKAGV